MVGGETRGVEPYRTQAKTRLYGKNEAQLKCDVKSGKCFLRSCEETPNSWGFFKP